LEPVNDSVIDQSGEFSSSLSERFTNGGETERHMEILFGLVNEPLPTVFSCIGNTVVFNFGSHVIDNLILFITSVQIGDFTRGQQIVNVNQETFVSNLTFSEKPQESFVLNGSFVVIQLNISLKISQGVRSGNGNIHSSEVHNIGGQFG
jgi:hypothetical protein